MCSQSSLCHKQWIDSWRSRFEQNANSVLRLCSCLLIQEMKVTKTLILLISLYLVEHNTCTMHGRSIKTRYFGLMLILRSEKASHSVKHDRMQLFFEEHGSSHFGLRQVVLLCARQSLVVSFLPLARHRVMPRRGWSTMEVPDGWPQFIRGPHPKSERWPRRNADLQRTQHSVSVQTQPEPQHRRRRGSSRKLWKSCPVEWANPRQIEEGSKRRRGASIQMEQCESFISRSQRRLAELDNAWPRKNS